MTYAEMLADLITITARPDLSADLEVALRRSTLKMHGLEFWKFDLTFVNLTVATPAFLMTVDTATAFTRYRNLCFIKANDAANTDPMSISYGNGGQGLPMYEPADANRLVDSYGRNLTNIHYQVGRVIHIRSSVAPDRLYAGYYQRPVVSPINAYSSWIADEYPYAIIDDAAQSIFNTIGKDDKVRLWQQKNMEHLQILKTNYLEEETR